MVSSHLGPRGYGIGLRDNLPQRSCRGESCLRGDRREHGGEVVLPARVAFRHGPQDSGRVEEREPLRPAAVVEPAAALQLDGRGVRSEEISYPLR